MKDELDYLMMGKGKTKPKPKKQNRDGGQPGFDGGTNSGDNIDEGKLDVDEFSLTVYLKPDGEISKSATWQISGHWFDSGETIGIEPGEYTVGYRDIDGWKKPPNETIIIINESLQLVKYYSQID